jgi:hypothetical protein
MRFYTLQTGYTMSAPAPPVLGRDGSPLVTVRLHFTWRFDTIPSFETLRTRTSLPEEAFRQHLEQPVSPFVAKIPMFVGELISREFPGGTLLSLLQFLYAVYHAETVPLYELDPVLAYPQPHVVERFRRYIDQTLAGNGVLRYEMLYPNTILTGIRRNKILISWE